MLKLLERPHRRPRMDEAVALVEQLLGGTEVSQDETQPVAASDSVESSWPGETETRYPTTA